MIGTFLNQPGTFQKLMTIHFLHRCRLCQQTFAVHETKSGSPIDIDRVQDVLMDAIRFPEEKPVALHGSHICGDPALSRQCGVTDLVGAQLREDTQP